MRLLQRVKTNLERTGYYCAKTRARLRAYLRLIQPVLPYLGLRAAYTVLQIGAPSGPLRRFMGLRDFGPFVIAWANAAVPWSGRATLRCLGNLISRLVGIGEQLILVCRSTHREAFMLSDTYVELQKYTAVFNHRCEGIVTIDAILFEGDPAKDHLCLKVYREFNEQGLLNNPSDVNKFPFSPMGYDTAVQRAAEAFEGNNTILRCELPDTGNLTEQYTNAINQRFAALKDAAEHNWLSRRIPGLSASVRRVRSLPPVCESGAASSFAF